MNNNEGKEPSSSAGTPLFWSSSGDSRGETTLTYDDSIPGNSFC